MTDSIELSFKCPICDKKIPFTVPAFVTIEQYEEYRRKDEYPIDEDYYRAKARYLHSIEHIGELDKYGVRIWQTNKQRYYRLHFV